MKSIDVFIHIPKSAGTTIRSLIEANYSESEQLSIYRTGGTVLHDFLVELNPLTLQECKIIYGHIPVVIHNYTDRRCDYFTFLRDPIQRAISFFKFVKYDFPAHPLHKKFSRGDVTFPMWCNRKHIEANKQTQMLAGFDRVNFCDAEMLGNAKKSLHNFKYFGFSEKFSESVINCASTMGWDIDGLEIRNISSLTNDAFLDKEGATMQDIDNLKQVNRYDLELYEFARNLAISKGFVVN